MELELRRPKAYGRERARKLGNDLKLFGHLRETRKDVARRIISVSGKGDQTGSSAGPAK